MRLETNGALKAGSAAATAVEAVVVLLAIVYVCTGVLGVLFAWDATAALYILGGLVGASLQASSRRAPDRPGLVGPLSWVLPLVSSFAGIYSAVFALTAEAPAGGGSQERTLIVTFAAVGIVLSWVLLHIGMAQSYQALWVDSDGSARFEFPGTKKPVLLDFLYFSFTIGTAFATSDIRVLVGRVRFLVILHSVAAFFYNAFVVAVAFQVLQQIIPGR